MIRTSASPNFFHLGTVSLLALIMIFSGGCADDSGEGPPPGRKEKIVLSPVLPAHHEGEECTTCHTDWNLLALHDAGSAQYNADCIKCHGNMMWEESLSDLAPAAHPVMMPYALAETGEDTLDNSTCLYCHPTVDFLEKSAGNLRKQVAAGVCVQCHRPGERGRPLYLE